MFRRILWFLIILGTIVYSQIKKILPTLLFTFGLFVLTVYTFYPGFLNMDSEWQLKMADLFKFYDWHPPMMSVLWAGLNHIYYGTPSILVFHNIIFWVALFLFSFKVFPNSHWKRLTLILLFSFFPPIYIQLGGIWKDTALAVCLFLACVLLLYLTEIISRKKKVVVIFITLLLLFYALSVRLNSIPAIVIICFWLGEILWGSKLFRNILFAAGLSIVFVLINKIIVYDFLHTIHEYPFQQVQIHDLTAISVAKKQLILPDYLKQDKSITLETVIKNYSPSSVGYFIYVNQTDPFRAKPIICRNSNHVNAMALDKLWLTTIITNPISYIMHRMQCFIELMISCISWKGEICAIPYHMIFHATIFYKLYCKFLTSDFMSCLFHGWIYLINCLFCVFIAIRLRNQLEHYRQIFYISLSGALYALGYFFYTPANEFRYLYWTVIAATIAMILFIKDLFATIKTDDSIKSN